MNSLQKETCIPIEIPSGPVIVIGPDKVRKRDEIIGRALLVTDCSTAQSMQEATSALKELDSMYRAVIKEGERLRKPFHDIAKRIKAIADEFVSPLEEQRVRIGGMIAEQVTAQQHAAKKLEEQRRAEVEAEITRIEAEQTKAKTEEEYERLEMAKQEALRSLCIVEPQSPRGATVRSYWKFEVMDVRQLPPQFVCLVPNEPAIQAAIDNGAREIPGCRIWEVKRSWTRTQ